MSELIEIEESFDPLRQVRVEVRRVPISTVYVSDANWNDKEWDNRFELPRGVEAIQVTLSALPSCSYQGSTRLQKLGQFISLPGDDSYSPEKIAAMFAHLGLEIVEVKAR